MPTFAGVTPKTPAGPVGTSGSAAPMAWVIEIRSAGRAMVRTATAPSASTRSRPLCGVPGAAPSS